MTTTVRHAQPFGRTTNWKPTAVYVERVVNLTPDLSEIEARRVENIVLRKGDGYDDHEDWTLDPKNALELYHALGNALMAIREMPAAPTSRADS